MTSAWRAFEDGLGVILDSPIGMIRMNSRVSMNPASLQAALAFEQAEYVRRNPRSAEMAAAAAIYLPGGTTRSSLWYDPFPLCMVRGEGSHLVDADGHE